MIQGVMEALENDTRISDGVIDGPKGNGPKAKFLFLRWVVLSRSSKALSIRTALYSPSTFQRYNLPLLVSLSSRHLQSLSPTTPQFSSSSARPVLFQSKDERFRCNPSRLVARRRLCDYNDCPEPRMVVAESAVRSFHLLESIESYCFMV